MGCKITMANKELIDKIKYAMSLREPQEEALAFLDKISAGIEYKTATKADSERAAVKKVADVSASANCEKPREISVASEFSFPSFCFDLATGIGKTRLMGANIYYLYKMKGYRHFFILAPGDTIYEKLKKECVCSHPKYLFKGLEAEMKQPKVFNGENYLQYNDYNSQLDRSVYHDDIEIFIFNIGKIYTRGDTTFKFHRFQETLGKSFAEVLNGFDDLVICMDEAHRYYAPQSMKAIDYLKPVLGLEFTATPKSNSNVIYSYDLAKGAGKFLKIPVMNGRTNMSGYNADDIEEMKLSDGMHLHENRKKAINKYCTDNNLDYVKPIVLIACKDTEHAKKVRAKIDSDSFFDGKYKDKVIEIHSGSGSGSETEENIYKLLTIENSRNPVEIVIHVYKLKEGWDVNNLFTIIPLNAAKSEILAMQTIGRGLRLPFGKITNEEEVDTLDIVAHDHYREIVEDLKANPIFKTRDLDSKKIEETTQIIIEPNIGNAQLSLFDGLFSFNEETQKIEKDDINDPMVQEKLYREYLKNIALKTKKEDTLGVPQQSLFDILEKPAAEATTEQIKEIAAKKAKVMNKDEFIAKAKAYVTTCISVPQILVQVHTESPEFKYLDIKCSKNFEIEASKIERFDITTNELLDSIDAEILEDPNPVNTLAVLLLDNIAEFDGNDADFILDIVNQYLNIIGGDNKHKKQIVRKYALLILDDIKEQVLASIKPTVPQVVYAIQNANISFGKQIKLTKAKGGELPYISKDFVKSEIRKHVFTGYKKSYYEKSGFDSDAERRLSVVLEEDKNIIRWIKPPLNQIGIYYEAGQQYNPDFLVETSTEKFMIEVKADDELEDDKVKLKKEEGELWCKYASLVDADSKKWSYRLIADKHIVTGESLKNILGLAHKPVDLEGK